MANVSLGTLRDYMANKPVTATMQNAATGTNNGTDLSVAGYGVALLQVTGTFVATITVRGSLDGNNFADILCEEIITGARSTTITAPGVYRVNCLGFQKLRAAITSYTSGSVTVYGVAEPFSVFTGNIQLTGSSVQDSQSIPMTQAQKDVAMRAYENIIDIIGAENVRCLVPLWESSGTVVKDILFPEEIQFDVVGATLAQPGPLHPCVSLDGINDYLKQKPILTYTTPVSSSNFDLDSSTKMIAQKLPAGRSWNIGFCNFSLKKIGSPVAEVVVEIVEDNAGLPTGSVVSSGTSDALSTSSMPTSFSRKPFPFTNSPYIHWNGEGGKTYWLRIKYSTATIVDISNYVAIQMDTSSSFGSPCAIYNGDSWTVQSSSSLLFEVYNASFNFIIGSDFSVVVVGQGNKATESIAIQPFIVLGNNLQNLAVYTHGGSIIRSHSNGIHMGGYSPNVPSTYCYGIQPYLYPLVMGFTYSYSASTDKIKCYVNGRLINKNNGTANAGVNQVCRPVYLGTLSIISNDFTESFGYWFTKGLISSLIMTKNVLTDAQMGKVTNQLLTLRRRY